MQVVIAWFSRSASREETHADTSETFTGTVKTCADTAETWVDMLSNTKDLKLVKSREKEMTR